MMHFNYPRYGIIAHLKSGIRLHVRTEHEERELGIASYQLLSLEG